MKPFEYKFSNKLDEIKEILSHYGPDAKILAGGTDLILELRRKPKNYPKTIVDISFLQELDGIFENSNHIIIKPLSTHTKICKSDIIKNNAFLLCEAASQVGSLQIRNRGTIGGNIMNAAACADTVPPLIALNAEITLQSKNGIRNFQLSDFFIKPYKTKANPEEILTEIKINNLPKNAKSAFVKLGRRNALSISRLSVAAVLLQDQDGKIIDARIVPGAAFPTWQRVLEAEQMLVGQKPSVELFKAAGTKVSEVMISYTGRRWSTEYKEPVIAALVRRALEKCL